MRTLAAVLLGVVVLIVALAMFNRPAAVDEDSAPRDAGVSGPTPVDEPPPQSAETVDEIRRAIEAIGSLTDDEEPTAEQIDLLLRGLLMDDADLALRCAAALEWGWLSGPEMARAVALLWPALTFEEDALVDFEELRSMAGSSELPLFLRSLPKFEQRSDAEYVLGNFHRLVRTDHLPQIAELAVSEDPMVRNAMLEDLVIPLDYTDRHREEIARALLELRPAAGGETSPLGAAAGGWPPLLTRVLERFVLGEADSSEAWRRLQGTIQNWAIRWGYDATPSNANAALLIALARHELARPMALRAMRHLTDAETDAVLRAATGDVEALAVASLAKRGDAEALRELTRRAESHSDPLALLFETVPPKEARAWFGERLLRKDDATALKTIGVLEDALLQSVHLWRIRIPDGLFDGLAAEVASSRRSGQVVAQIGALAPGCRTSEIARLAARLMTETLPPPDAFAEDDRALAFLEVADPGGLRRMLRAWTESDVAELRERGLRQLLVVGDRASASALISFVEGLDDVTGASVEAAGGGREIDVMLARSGGPKVETWLRENDRWLGLAVLGGLHEEIAKTLIEQSELTAAETSVLRAAALEGKPLEGLARFLAMRPDELLWNVWRADTPAVRAYLHRLRARRTLKLHGWATGQLAAMGDEAARAEVWAIMKTGRYRPVDDADLEAMTLGHDFTTLPHWLDELETNCCRYNVVAQVFDELFDVDPEDYRYGYARTSAGVMRDWWKSTRGRFTFSRIARHWVVQAD